jgi:hypothetical protein
VAPQEFTDDQRKAMLSGIHERRGRWDQVDPDTEIASIGEGIGLSEDESYALFAGSLWTKASSIRVVLIGPGAQCPAVPAESSGAKTI